MFHSAALIGGLIQGMTRDKKRALGWPRPEIFWTCFNNDFRKHRDISDLNSQQERKYHLHVYLFQLLCSK